MKEVYRRSARMPDEEKFGLMSQMRRSAVSIPSNIAEGSRRGSSKDFLQFLRIADGSASELETQLLISTDLFPQVEFVDALQELNEVQRMLGSLIQSISSHTH